MLTVQDQYIVSEENDQLDPVTQTLSMMCTAVFFWKAYAYEYIYIPGMLLAEAQDNRTHGCLEEKNLKSGKHKTAFV